MTRDKLLQIFQSLIEYIREKHEKEIDEAYEYFWEEEDPSEFLGGTALAMAFNNFDDWMGCDYINKETGKSFIDRYIEDKSPSDDEKAALSALKNSCLSLYEAKSIDSENITLNNMATGADISIKDDRLKALEPGHIFGARILDMGDGPIMTQSIYPFGNQFKDAVMTNLDAMYKRYAKHYEGETSMEKFLRQETYTINTVWVTCLFRAK